MKRYKVVTAVIMKKTRYSQYNCYRFLKKIMIKKVLGVFLPKRMRCASNTLNHAATKGVVRKKLRVGPNFATFNVTSFTYNGIFT